MGERQGQYVVGDGEAKGGWDRLRRENYCIWGEGGQGIDVDGELFLSHTYVYTLHIKKCMTVKDN